MGSEETKTTGLEDEAKQNEKKRSQENITLEDRKEELKRNKDSTNTSYDEDANDRNFSIKKAGFTCNTSPHLKIIPSIQFLQDAHHYPERGSTSQTNVSYVKPEKYILEFLLDVLQRSDPDELFAKPINYDGAHKSLDFATIRAKINMEHYMSIDSFQFDVYRLCYNAMYYNDKDSRHYQVAVALHSLAKRVFEDISVLSLQRFHLESLPKNAQGGIPQVGKRKTIGHARFRHTLPRDSSSYASNNVSSTELNPHALGINISKQENSIPGATSLLNYQDKRETNKNGGGRKCNSSITIPKFLDKNVASISKDIGAGASSSQMEFRPSQDANFSTRANNANNSFPSQQNQYGCFQGLAYPMGPFPMIQHSISSSGPITSSSNVMRGNLKESEGEGEKKEKDGEGTSTNDGEIKELDLDLKL